MRTESADFLQELRCLASGVASLVEGEDPALRRRATLLLTAVLVGLDRGSTCLFVEDEDFDVALRAVGANPEDVAAIRTALVSDDLGLLGGIVKRRGQLSPLILEEGRVYAHRLYRAELFVAEAIAERFGLPEQPLSEPALERARRELADRGLRLSDEQSHAVERAARDGICIISGGPGTGKTSIVSALLRLLARLGVPVSAIALAAPTGKAAHRLEQALEMQLGGSTGAIDRTLESLEPKTLHRLLGYSPKTGRFRYGPDRRLGAQVVIVDECSMIDLVMMRALLSALADDARLVLIGDGEQLPSVEAGAVFRDLVSLDRSVVRLTKSYRMDSSDASGRQILSAARIINRGEGDALLGTSGPVIERERADELGFSGVDRLDSSQASRFFDVWFERAPGVRRGPQDEAYTIEDHAALSKVFEQASQSKILTFFRGSGATGARAINLVLHSKQLLASRDGLEIRGFSAYDPVIVERNDYDRGLFNGDLGIVLPTPDGSLSAFFARGPSFVAFDAAALAGEISLAYALTVHKAQGSEFSHVALVLPERDTPHVARELVYTAVTRARRSVTLVGDIPILTAALSRRIHRTSGLSARISAREGAGS